MDINYNKKYAYAEIYAILEWLGDDYKRKVPQNLLRLFRLERKFGYEPNIDFTKSLKGQVRQETLDIIAYLQYSCWLEDEDEKAKLKAIVDENAQKAKEEKRRQRIERRNNMSLEGTLPLNAQVDKALESLKNS